MKNKATIIALIILLALGAYVYYFEHTPIEEDEMGNKKIVLFPKFDPKSTSESPTPSYFVDFIY